MGRLQKRKRKKEKGETRTQNPLGTGGPHTHTHTHTHTHAKPKKKAHKHTCTVGQCCAGKCAASTLAPGQPKILLPVCLTAPCCKRPFLPTRHTMSNQDKGLNNDTPSSLPQLNDFKPTYLVFGSSLAFPCLMASGLRGRGSCRRNASSSAEIRSCSSRSHVDGRGKSKSVSPQ